MTSPALQSPPAPRPRLHLHRAVRSSQLIDGLAALVSDEPLDPFTAEVVSVPTPGVERWLGQALSMRLGVAAGITFTPFARWMDQVWAEASAPLLPPGVEDDPWSLDHLTWTVLRVLDESAAESWAAPVNRHIGRLTAGEDDGGTGGRRFLTARRLAGLFHRYHRERPAMVSAWLAGDDVDAVGGSLDRRHRWQAELWRRVRSTVAVPSPAERIDAVHELLVQHPERLDLPPRLSVFGLNRLDPIDRTVVQGLAARRDVHLWLAHPSPQRWQRVAARTVDELWPARASHHRTASADEPADAGNPLLSQLGRDVVEFQHVVTHLAADVIDHDHGSPSLGDTVLGQLQHAIVTDRPPTDDPSTILAPDDRSLQVHSCHGPDRQVEVLREVVCGLLADRPDLEPRDIMIMCPDLLRFAPLVGAAFDLTGTASAHPDQRLHPGRRLRIRIADQSLSQVNPVLAVLERVLDLVNARLTASDLIDVCASGPVATRFRFDADDLERLEHLIRSSGMRWGLDVGDRARFDLAAYPQNTVAAGLDRMLLGVARSEADHRHLGMVLPLDEVESSDVDLVGRLAELTERLAAVLESLTGPHPLSDWVSALHGAISMLTASEPGESWQVGHAWGCLQDLVDAGRPGHDSEGALLDLGDLRTVVDEVLAGRPTRANFRTGSLTLSSLAPMRSVPHKVICLLGMDDQAFPRGHTRDGDDLLAVEPRVGDRDRRSEDRQLLLDAVMAAEDTVVVIHSGRDPRTNTPRPAAVPIGELLDTVATLVRTADGGDVRSQLVVDHPLQPYDARNFAPGAAVRAFDRAGLAGARAASEPRTPAPPVFSRTPLPPPAAPSGGDRTEPIDLADLQSFYKHPVRAFLRERGRWFAPPEDDDDLDALPLELDGLEKWQIGDRILAARRSGVDEATLAAAEWRRGQLPPKRLGSRVLDAVLDDVDQIHTMAQRWRGQPRREVDLRVEGDGWALTGTSTEVHGQTLVSVGFSRPGPAQWLAAWWELLALTGTEPEVPWRAVIIGRGSKVATLGPVSPGFASTVLADALELRATGLLAPLPLPPKTAGSYLLARQRYEPDRALDRIAKDWRFERDKLWEQFWEADLADLTADPAIDAERRGGVAEPSRFGTLAQRVFQPLLHRSEGIR